MSARQGKKHRKAPGASRGRGSFSTTPEQYAALTDRAREMFPSWSSDPELLRVSVVELVGFIRKILAMDEPVTSVLIRHECVPPFALHFAEGRAWADPAIDLTPQLVDLLHALKLALGEQLILGRPGVSHG